MNFRCGLKRYWKREINPLFFLFVLQLSFVQTLKANEPICAEGILFQAELQCFMVAPERRIKVAMRPQMLFLPDSLIRISGKYPALLWVEEKANWQEFIGKHIRLTGTIREFFSGEFLVCAEQMLACDPTPKTASHATDLTEEELSYWEKQIPLMATTAFRQEALKALFQGFDVVQSHDNALWATHPNGTETFIKTLTPPFPVEPRRIIDLDSKNRLFAPSEPVDK